MYRPRIIPCLLLKDKGLVKTKEFKNPVYLGDPINAVRIFNELEADELVFLDIEATNENRVISTEIVKKIGDEAFMPFGVGGGIKKVSEIRDILNSGAEKVILNSHAVKNPKFVKEASEIFGSQSVTISIDVKKTDSGEEVFICGGKVSTKKSPEEVALEMEKAGAGEIILNSIDNDGKMEGYDLDLVERVSKTVKIPVVACGGAGRLEDFNKAIKNGAMAVAAGSLFVFAGKGQGVLINYPEKKEILESFK